jgi:hypothetical protein
MTAERFEARFEPRRGFVITSRAFPHEQRVRGTTIHLRYEFPLAYAANARAALEVERTRWLERGAISVDVVEIVTQHGGERAS